MFGLLYFVRWVLPSCEQCQLGRRSGRRNNRSQWKQVWGGSEKAKTKPPIVYYCQKLEIIEFMKKNSIHSTAKRFVVYRWMVQEMINQEQALIEVQLVFLDNCSSNIPNTPPTPKFNYLYYNINWLKQFWKEFYQQLFQWISSNGEEKSNLTAHYTKQARLMLNKM